MKNNSKAGFSLIELSIVLVILSILISGGLVVVAKEIEAGKIKTTNDRLQVVVDAIQLYYETHGALPCPADGTDAVADATFGVGLDPIPTTAGGPTSVNCTNATYTIATNSYVGMLPIRSLELPDQHAIDGWRNRFTYAVSKHCVDPDNWDAAEKHKCTTGSDDPVIGTDYDGDDSAAPQEEPGGTITIEDNNSTPRERTDIAAYVVISHGKNGLGAWNNSGTPNSDSTKTAEIENHDFDTNVIFRDDMIFDPNTDPANYFDDIIIWKTGPQIQYNADN